MTPILYASLNGQTEIIIFLLKVACLKGINVNDSDLEWLIF